MPQVHQIEPIQAHDSLLLSPGWSPQSSRAEPRKLTNHILSVQVTRFPSKDASVNHVEKVHVVLRKWKQPKKTHAIHFQSKPQFIFGHLIGLPWVVQHARILFINPFVSRLHHLDDWMLQNLLHHQVASAHWKTRTEQTI